VVWVTKLADYRQTSGIRGNDMAITRIAVLHASDIAGRTGTDIDWP
jgi:hypothetical protein